MRFWEIDFARGIAIIMMVIFHFLWTLIYFDLLTLSLYAGFWGYFQKVTAGLFIFLVGVVLTISYNRNKKNYEQRFLRRGMIVFGGGLLVTLVTLIFFPRVFIYFGILHFIGVSILLSIPLITKKYFNLILGIALLLLQANFNLFSLEIPYTIWLGLETPFATIDFFPIIPWFAAVLFGIFVGNTLYANGARKFRIGEYKSRASDFMQLLGRNSLLIYFVHQPVLFTTIFILTQL